jgi:hypothetical protein
MARIKDVVALSELQKEANSGAVAKSSPKSSPETTPKSLPDSTEHPDSERGLNCLSDEAFSYQVITGSQALDLEAQAWAVSRPLDESRVQKLYREQAKRLTQGLSPSLFLPVPITVAVLRGRGQADQHYIMDGQHRLEVLRRLNQSEQGTVRLSMCKVQCGTQEELEELYVRINDGAPLPASYLKKKFATWVGQFTALLVKAFPKAISASERPRRPNFNPVLVRERLQTLPALRKAVSLGTITAEKMLRMVHTENAIEAQISAAAQISAGGWKITPSLLRKANETQFPLGLRRDWPVTIAVRALALLGV